MRKQFHNLKNTVRGILLFFNNMPDKKPEDTTDILSWENSLKNMADDTINKSLSASMKKGLTNNEKELTVTFVRGKSLENMFGDTLLLLDVYGKEKFINTLT